MQGLTRGKLFEVEEILKNQCDVICLTETHQKTEKLEISKGIEKVECMRKLQDKKGGGLLVLWKQKFKAIGHSTKSSDILHVEFRVKMTSFHIILVYFSVANKEEDRIRNKQMRKEVEKIVGKLEDLNQIYLVLGDMNGHTGLIGYQKENENGKMVKDWMNNFGLVLLNLDEKCTGTYTWGRNDQKSVIDYALANGHCYQLFSAMKIDEDKEIFDLSDHNMITVELKLPTRTNSSFNQSQVVTRMFFKTDDESLQKFSSEVNIRLCSNVTDIKHLNDLISQTANDILQAKYTKRVHQQKQVKEPPWITEEIRKKIKERRRINRQKRNAKDYEEEKLFKEMYEKKKREVQRMVKEAITIHEKKTTAEVRSSKNKSKSLFENIDKLRKKERKENVFSLHDEQGKQLERIEAEEALMKFWRDIYQQHENEIKQIWNAETRDEYEREVEEGRLTNLDETWKHLKEKLVAGSLQISKMDTPAIEQIDVEQCIKVMKSKSAPGPDGLKVEMYKALVKEPRCLEALTNCFQNELDNQEKPDEWKSSRTKMIPKVQKPTAAQLRPIALTNVSYKIFMSIVREKIELHLSENHAVLDTQAGFTKGGKIEDNLFILNYCVEKSYRSKKPLYVTSIDYSKAFDSVKRDKIIRALMLYKVHPKIIDAVAGIYVGDYTEIAFKAVASQQENGDDRQQNVAEAEKESLLRLNVTSGIRQGCTGSTTLFKILTYIISQELYCVNIGFKNKDVHIPVLFFADDGLVLTQSKEETEKAIQVISKASAVCGLQINKEKSNVIIFNTAEETTEIGGIPVTDEIKYLGITIRNKKNLFKRQKQIIHEKAQKMANMTYNVICKSCNKLMIGKTYWKCLALPVILYGTRVIPLTEAEVQKLQTTENAVYRSILAAPRYAPNCTLRGEVGSSLMKSRIMEGHLQFIRDAFQRRNELILKIVKLQMEDGRSKWSKTAKAYMETLNLTMTTLGSLKKEELKSAVQEWDNQRWLQEVQSKSTLGLYGTNKEEIIEEAVYDNTPASAILYRARSNTLPLNDRKRHTNEDTTCDICREEEETLAHFILHCPALSETRRRIVCLQKPFIQDEANILGNFLFDKTALANNKEDLYKLWRSRDRQKKAL